MATIYDIAKKAGVSPSTVSNAINRTGKVAPKTEERIFKIIEEMNYIPNYMAQGLKATNPKIIGVFCEDISAFPSSEIINGISKVCGMAGYKLILVNLHTAHENKDGIHLENYYTEARFKENLNENLAQMMAFNIAGIIYTSMYPHNIDNLFPDLSIPISYCYAYSDKKEYCVNCNDYQGSKLAMDYLISMGHKKIALICGVFNTLPTHKRLQGYHEALMKHNIPYIPEYVVEGKWQYSCAYHAFEQLMKLPDPPTAAFVMSDLMAHGVINAALDSGINIPEDFSVHGFDNVFYASQIRPALTTVALPFDETGKKAAETIIDLIEKCEPNREELLLDCTHIVRKTVAPPKKS